MFINRRTLKRPANPTGLCACGCGNITPISSENHPERGYYKGQHVRYLHGHHVPKGPNAKAWKGGRWTHKGGYVYVSMPEHPHANRDGYIYEHRAVMEAAINRLLEPKERVHHLNHKRDDNRIENLRLFSSHGEHVTAEHSIGDWVKRLSPEERRQNAAAGGRAGAAVRWAGHVKATPKPSQGYWSPWTRFL